MFKMKLKLLVAAVAFAVAGGAQAAAEVGNGNGDLFVSLTTGVNAVGGGTAAFDLGFTMSQAATWNGVTGLQLSWNLSTGAFSSNNAGIAASNATLGTYGSALSTFQGLSAYSLNTAQMSVLAFDSTGEGIFGSAGRNVLSTSNSTNGGISNTGAGIQPTASFGPLNSGFNNTFANTTVLGYQNTMNADPGMAAAVGANTATFGSADHYGTAMANLGTTWSGFDNNGLYAGQYDAGSTTFAGKNKALPFFSFSQQSASASQRANYTAYGVDLDMDGTIEFNGAEGNEFALWTLQGDVLTFSNPAAMTAPIPEPGTYAMMLAGLALLGGVARRRMKN